MTDNKNKKVKNDKQSPVNNAHDKLIKTLLANTINAREIIESYLPKEVIALLDLDYLEQQQDTFIDARHRMHETDVLFKTRCKGSNEEAYIWILIEQQRDPDAWLPLRIFCYIAVIWDTLRKRSKSRAKSVRIPFIFPLVISNATKPYTHSLNLRDLIAPEAAKPLFDELFKNPIQLLDLPAIPDDAMRMHLQDRLHAQALLLTLKHIENESLQDYLETVLIHTLHRLDAAGYRDDVANLLYYIYNEGSLNDSNHFFAFLHHKFSKEVEEQVMTLGQQAALKAEQKGMLKQAEKSVLSMIKKNIPIEDIVEISGLPKVDVLRLYNSAKKSN